MRGLLSTIFALCLARSSVLAEADEVARYTLDNGLRVVLDPHAGGRKVALVVRYDVGSRDDPAGYHGLAHLVEHLSFRRSSLPAAYEDLGSTSFNGITTPDDTYYFAELPALALQRALWIESERMAFIVDGLDKQALRHEQAIVTHEWRQNVHSQAAGDAGHLVYRVMFPAGHPYHDLGETPDDVAAVRPENAQWFAQGSYVPERATVVVSGAFDAARVRAWIAEYFGAVRARPARVRASAPPPSPLKQGCEIRFADYGYRARLRLHWPVPPAASREAAALAVLAGYLEAVLTSSLVERDGPASWLDVSLIPHELTALFVIDVGPRPGQSFSRVRSAISRALRDVAAAHVDDDKLERVRASHQKMVRNDGHADAATRAFRLSDESADALQNPEAYARLTRAEIAEIAARWLDAGHAVTTYLDDKHVRDHDEIQCGRDQP